MDKTIDELNKELRLARTIALCLGVLVVLIVAFLIYFVIAQHIFTNGTKVISPEDEKVAISSALEDNSVNSFITSNPKYEASVSAVTSRQRKDYPVIFANTSNNAVMVEYKSENNRGVLCVVDGTVLKRCFNNIGIGFSSRKSS